jgi:hypothetical protein
VRGFVVGFGYFLNLCIDIVRDAEIQSSYFRFLSGCHILIPDIQADTNRITYYRIFKRICNGR